MRMVTAMACGMLSSRFLNCSTPEDFGETIAETNRNKSGNATAKTSGSAMSNVKISLRRHKAERSFIMSARSALENSL